MDQHLPSGIGEKKTANLDVPRGGFLTSPLPWFAIRDEALALVAAALALDPSALANPRFSEMASQLDYGGVRGIVEEDGGITTQGLKVYDFCSGVGTLAAAAAALGCDAHAVEIEPAPALVSRVINTYCAEPSILRPSAEDGWRGLMKEVDEAARRIQNHVFQTLANCREWSLSSANLIGRLWARYCVCPTCGRTTPIITDARVSEDLVVDLLADRSSRLVQTSNPDKFQTWFRGQLSCVNCGASCRMNPADAPFAAPIVEIFENQLGEIQLKAIPTPKLLEFDLQGEKSVGGSSSSLFDDVRAVWSWAGKSQDAIPISRACLPSQRMYLGSVARALAMEIAIASNRMTAMRRDALACSLAVVFCSIAPDLSVFAAWNPRQATPRRAFARGALSYGSPFFEAGKATIDRWTTVGVSRLRRRAAVVASRTSRPVTVQVADAASTGLPEESGSVVLWDPAVYDLVDYRSAARPYELLLESIAEVLPADLVPSNHERSQQTSRGHVAFDEFDYRRQISSQAEEVSRVLQSDGRLAVFWPARSPDELEGFLGLLAPAGFEIEQALRISRGDQPGLLTDSDRTYVLLLRKIPLAARSAHSQVDAAKVLELADEGLPALNHGLADILIRRMSDAEVEGLMPSNLRGHQIDRLAEFVAMHQNPAELLAELGRAELREELLERGVAEDVWENKTSQQLANLLLEDLGYSIPQSPSFSVKDALEAAARSLNDLQYAQQIDAARGSATSCFIAIERVLRYSVVAWSKMPSSPAGLLESVLQQKDRRSDLQRLTFGDWELLFTQVPRILRDSNPGAMTFVNIARAMKAGRVDEKLSAVIAARNSIQHDGDPRLAVDVPMLIRSVSDAVRQALAALVDLDARRFLPITVIPLEEIRDRFGRRRLVLSDTDANRIEVYVPEEIDLRSPLIYIPSGSNPRDISPTLLRAHEIVAEA